MEDLKKREKNGRKKIEILKERKKINDWQKKEFKNKRRK